MAKSKRKFYVVWKGRQKGIFKTWPECQKQIQGYAGAKYKSFPTWDEALTAWRGDYKDFIAQSAGSKSKSKKNPEAQEQLKLKERIIPSYSVDAACSGNPGNLEYRGVDTETEEHWFHEGPFEYGTNNIGEFLALVQALRLLKEKSCELPIYTDSRTAMAWVRNQKVNTSLEVTEDNQILFEKMDSAIEWLQANQYTNKILKWDTVNWGEIPADFGRK